MKVFCSWPCFSRDILVLLKMSIDRFSANSKNNKNLFFSEELIALILPYFNFHQLCLVERSNRTFQSHVITECKRIKRMNLLFTYFSQESSFLAKLAKYCPNLEKITNFPTPKFRRQFSKYQRYFPNLKILYYRNDNIRHAERLQITVDCFGTYLSLPFTIGAIDIFVNGSNFEFDHKSLIENGKSVESITCSQWSPKIRDLIDHCPNVQNLTLEYAGPEFLDYLPEVRSLKTLILEFFGHADQILWNNLHMMTSLTKLQIILHSSDIYANFVDDICQNISNLESLSLKFSPSCIGRYSFDKLIRLQKLKFLDLRCFINDGSHLRLPILEKLESLTLADATLSGTNLAGFEKLTCLSLSNLAKFEEVEFLLQILGRQLSSLSLTYCLTHFNFSELEKLMLYCPHLTYLSLYPFKNIDELIGTKLILTKLDHLSIGFYELDDNLLTNQIQRLAKFLETTENLKRFSTNKDLVLKLSRELCVIKMRKRRNFALDQMSVDGFAIH